MNLSLENLKALRSATSITFEFEATPTGAVSTITAARVVDLNDGFDPVERSVEVEASESVVNARDFRATSGRWVFDDPKSNPSLTTLLKYLKAGDIIKPRWDVNDTPKVLSDAGLVQDRFSVMVLRNRKNGTQPGVATFILANHLSDGTDRYVTVSDEAVADEPKPEVVPEAAPVDENSLASV